MSNKKRGLLCKIYGINIRNIWDFENNLVYIELANRIFSCYWCEIPSAYGHREPRWYTFFTLLYSLKCSLIKKSFQRFQLTINTNPLSCQRTKLTYTFRVSVPLLTNKKHIKFYNDRTNRNPYLASRLAWHNKKAAIVYASCLNTSAQINEWVKMQAWGQLNI